MKEIYILEPYTYKILDIVDEIESLMWTEKWRGYGDFEILTTSDVVKRHPELAKKENYIWIETGACYAYTDPKLDWVSWDTVMVIEDIKTTHSETSGGNVYIRGRSLETYLKRRIVAYRKEFANKAKARVMVLNLLRDNFIDGYKASYDDRAFTYSEFRYSELSAADKNVGLDTDEEVTFFGENLYDAILSICNDFDFGFSVAPIYPETGYLGAGDQGSVLVRIDSITDRSLDQTVNQPIVFSRSYNNIKTMSLDDSDMEYANYAFTVGATPAEGSDEERIESWVRTYPTSSKTYINGERREMFVDSSSLARTYTDSNGNEVNISYTSYKKQVDSNARKQLQKEKKKLIFDSEVEPYMQYEYGKDYTIGNLVSIEDMFGNYHTVQITEVTRAWDRNGYSVMPVFEEYDREKYEK